MNHFNISEQGQIDAAALSKALANVKDKGGKLDVDDSLDDLLIFSKEDDTNIKPQLLKTSVANKVTLEKSYSFPVSGFDVNQLGAGELENRISVLVKSWRIHKDYLLIREEYCELSIALNIIGLRAPAFRPMPKNPFKKSEWTPANLLTQQDRLVIECHWLYCRHEYVDIPDSEVEYQDLFDVDMPFSFELAASFASENWSNEYRAVEAFTLTNRQRCQLFALQGKVVYARYKAAKEGVGKGVNREPPREVILRQALSEWCDDNKRMIRLLQGYKDLWFARELLGNGASIREIAKLTGYISGTTSKSDKTVSDKLKLLDKHLLKVS